MKNWMEGLVEDGTRARWRDWWKMNQELHDGTEGRWVKSYMERLLEYGLRARWNDWWTYRSRARWIDQWTDRLRASASIIHIQDMNFVFMVPVDILPTWTCRVLTKNVLNEIPLEFSEFAFHNTFFVRHYYDRVYSVTNKLEYTCLHISLAPGIFGCDLKLSVFKFISRIDILSILTKKLHSGKTTLMISQHWFR